MNKNQNKVEMIWETGKIRFARWDGGGLESAKALLSGWFYMKDPKAIKATSDWYSGSNSLELLLAAKINWIWVTFSVGFSMHTESSFHAELKEFITKCHEHGITVTTYMSMVNLFIDDMRLYEPRVDDWLQQNLQGKPIPYGAAKYLDKPTRLIACLNHPEWREYLVTRLQQALDIGADGIMYDNFATMCRCSRCRSKWNTYQKAYTDKTWPFPEEAAAAELTTDEYNQLTAVYDLHRMAIYEEIYQMIFSYGVEKKPNFTLFGNFNTGYNAYVVPINNVVSTEDGKEPGTADGIFVHNAGFLRTTKGAAKLGRPSFIEYGGGRGRGKENVKNIDPAGVGATRFFAMDPAKHCLSLAETMAFGASLEITPEGEFLRDLYFRTTEAMENWKAISSYNTFFAANENLYANVCTATSIVSIHNSRFRRFQADDYAQRPALIGELSRYGVVMDVLFGEELVQQDLDHYKTMLLADVRVIDAKLLEIITRFSNRGGSIVATGETGYFNDHFIRQNQSVLTGLKNVTWLDDPAKNVINTVKQQQQTNVVTSFPQKPMENLDQSLLRHLAEILLNQAPLAVDIECSDFVLFNLTEDNRGNLLIHLLNYDDAKSETITITFKQKYPSHIQLFTPDQTPESFRMLDDRSIVLDSITSYSVLKCTGVSD